MVYHYETKADFTFYSKHGEEVSCTGLHRTAPHCREVWGDAMSRADPGTPSLATSRQTVSASRAGRPGNPDVLV